MTRLLLFVYVCIALAICKANGGQVKVEEAMKVRADSASTFSLFRQTTQFKNKKQVASIIAAKTGLKDNKSKAEVAKIEKGDVEPSDVVVLMTIHD